MTDEVRKVTLPVPQQIGGKEVSEIKLRKPFAGELRGLHVIQIVQMEVGTIEKLLSRISTPIIGPADFAKLEPQNLADLSVECADFFTGSKSSQKQ